MQDFIRYIPHTEEDIRKMLDAIGVKKLEDLFQIIPEEYRLFKPLSLPEPLSEPDLLRRFQGLQVPTIYFPLVVKGALMMEPTETESKESIDRFIETMIKIAKEAEENPDLLRQAPQRVKVRRLDEVLAARKPRLKWTKNK
jgi:hypothetical protein